MLEHGIAPQVIRIVHVGRAAELCALPGNIVDDTGLRLYLRTVRQGTVATDTNLPADTAVFTDFGGAGNSRQRGDDGIFSDFNVVRYLNQVVELHPGADNGRAHRCAVDGGRRAYLDPVVKNDVTDLRYFIVTPGFGVGGEAEAVAANHDISVQDTIIAHYAVTQDANAGVNYTVLADADVGPDVYLVEDHRPVTNTCSVFDNGKLTDVDALPKLGLSVHGRMSGDGPFGLGSFVLLIDRQQVAHGAVYVSYPQQGGGDGFARREVQADQYSGRSGVVQVVLVGGVCQEGNRPGSGFLDLGGGGNDHVGVALNGGADHFRKFSGGDFHVW